MPSPFARLCNETPSDIGASLEAESSNTSSGPRSGDSVTVERLVQRWTNIQDTSTLATFSQSYDGDMSDNQDATGIPLSDEQGGWGFEVQEVEEAEATENERPPSDSRAEHAPEQAVAIQVSRPRDPGAGDPMIGVINLPDKVAKDWHCYQKTLGDWGKVISFRWPKPGSVESKKYRNTRFAMTGPLTWDDSVLDGVDALNISLRLATSRLLWPTFSVPYSYCGRFHPYGQNPGLNKVIQGICHFYFEFMTNAELGYGLVLYPADLSNSRDIVQNVRKLYYATREGQIKFSKVSREILKAKKDAMINRILNISPRHDRVVPREYTRFTPMDWDCLDWHKSDLDNYYVEVRAKEV